MIDIIITYHQWLLVPALAPLALLAFSMWECRQ
jgi:hypothetical protein